MLARLLALPRPIGARLRVETMPHVLDVALLASACIEYGLKVNRTFMRTRRGSVCCGDSIVAALRQTWFLLSVQWCNAFIPHLDWLPDWRARPIGPIGILARSPRLRSARFRPIGMLARLLD